jgi:Kef-type K+ transport system membrane component KefB
LTQEILVLAVVLVAAEVGGLVAMALRLPRVTGQIAAGVLIGPSALGLVGDGPIVQFLAEIGALCILALAGLETDVATLRTVGRPALLAAVGGVLLPFAGGAGLAHAFGLDAHAALFVGAVLTATSVGISAATLHDLGLLRSRAGATIMGAAVADDVLGLIVLALVVADVQGSGSPVIAIAAMTAVGVGSLLVAVLLRGPLVRSLERLETVGGGLPGLVGLVLGAAWVYQALGGLAGITGAYFAGLLLADSEVGPRLRERLAHAGDAIGAPVFFVAIGLTADVRALGPALPLGLALLGAAIVGKLLGSGWGARIGGLPGRDATTVGIGMIARGEVALVAAATGVAAGAIDTGVYSALVLVALATTIVTPVLLAAWAGRARGFALPSVRRVVVPVPGWFGGSAGQRPAGPRPAGPRPAGPRPAGPRPPGPRPAGPRPAAPLPVEAE